MKYLPVLKAELQQAHNALYQTSDAWDLLYHYTDYEGLKGILEQKKLKYTRYPDFRDRLEIQGILTLIRKALLRNPTLCQAYSCLFESFSAFEDNYALSIACFSKAMNPLLWRYDANNGSGFAIGFNPALYHLTPENNRTYVGDKKGREDVRAEVQYGADVKKVIQTLLDIFERFYHQTTCQAEREKGLAYFIASLVRVLPLFKENGFKHEQEIRFFCCESALLPDPNTDEPPAFFDDAQRGTSTKLQNQPGKPVILRAFPASAISEIWVGYRCEFLEARPAIQKLLDEQGFDVNQIRIKQAPLQSKPKGTLPV